MNIFCLDLANYRVLIREIRVIRLNPLFLSLTQIARIYTNVCFSVPHLFVALVGEYAFLAAAGAVFKQKQGILGHIVEGQARAL